MIGDTPKKILDLVKSNGGSYNTIIWMAICSPFVNLAVDFYYKDIPSSLDEFIPASKDTFESIYDVRFFDTVKWIVDNTFINAFSNEKEALEWCTSTYIKKREYWKSIKSWILDEIQKRKDEAIKAGG